MNKTEILEELESIHWYVEQNLMQEVEEDEEDEEQEMYQKWTEALREAMKLIDTE